MNLSRLFDFSWASQGSAWVGLITLVALEIVLGIDNIVFISILSGKLPAAQQPQARKTGLILALIPRIILLMLLPLVLQMEKPLFHLPFDDPAPGKGGKLGLSLQDLIVIFGGLFLIAKSTHEIHGKLEGDGELHVAGGGMAGSAASYAGVLVQIMVLNIVFSLDSIITAIGMVPKEQVMVMVLAVLISTAVMAMAVNKVSAFVEKHPTVKMLALSFLLLIGLTLLIEGFHAHMPKGYVYFAMGFSVFVEMLNLRIHRKKAPIALREPH